MSKFANALGVLELKGKKGMGDSKGIVEFEVRPKGSDLRAFRTIMMKKEHRKERDKMIDSFEEFVSAMIIRDVPVEDGQDKDAYKQEVRDFVSLNWQDFLNEFLIAFKFATREDIEKAKKEAIGDIKNVIGDD